MWPAVEIMRTDGTTLKLYAIGSRSWSRRDFARRLTSGLPFEREALKGVVILKEGQLWSHDPATGSRRLIPKQGVVLIVTDDEKRESIFGFLRYPDEVLDHAGRVLAKTGKGKDWSFRDFKDHGQPLPKNRWKIRRGRLSQIRLGRFCNVLTQWLALSIHRKWAR